MEAAMAAEVSLHCVICFEEFSLKERPPVVLPCGHTYVCLVCAKRLKKCMECREPLYLTPPASVGPNKAPTVNTGRSPVPPRYGRGRQTHQQAPVPVPSQPPQQIQLPLPKNLVLLSLIESAECQARLVKEAKGKLSYGDETSENSEVEGEESDNDGEQSRALTGMTALAGACGTYAVRDPEGLAVLPFDPNKQHQTDQEDQPVKDEEKKADEVREPFTIEPGSKVQVVGVDDGVYKLARGAGFIVASVSQLVKVGAALETSCQLEAMLDTVKRREHELERTLAEAKQLAVGLEQQIEQEQEQSEGHPVIAQPTSLEADVIENDLSTSIQGPATPQKADDEGDDASPREAFGSAHSVDSTVVQLGDRADITPFAHQGNHAVLLNSPAHSCPPLSDAEMAQPFIEGRRAGLPSYRVNTEDEFHGITLGFGCGSALFGERLLESQPDGEALMTLSFDDSLVEDNQTIGGLSRDTNSANTAPLQATQYASRSDSPMQPESPVRSGSFDGVNFRTGMSGHRGLSQAKKKSSPSAARRNIRMMSEHRGIGSVRAIARRTPTGKRILSPPDKTHLR